MNVKMTPYGANSWLAEKGFSTKSKSGDLNLEYLEYPWVSIDANGEVYRWAHKPCLLKREKTGLHEWVRNLDDERFARYGICYIGVVDIPEVECVELV